MATFRLFIRMKRERGRTPASKSFCISTTVQPRFGASLSASTSLPLPFWIVLSWLFAVLSPGTEGLAPSILTSRSGQKCHAIVSPPFGSDQTFCSFFGGGSMWPCHPRMWIRRGPLPNRRRKRRPARTRSEPAVGRRRTRLDPISVEFHRVRDGIGGSFRTPSAREWVLDPATAPRSDPPLTELRGAVKGPSLALRVLNWPCRLGYQGPLRIPGASRLYDQIGAAWPVRADSFSARAIRTASRLSAGVLIVGAVPFSMQPRK